MRFRRLVAPLRELLTIVVRREHGVFDDAMDEHLRDLYDHVVTVHEEIEMSRDLLASALDGHLSIVSNRMNETVLKVSAWAAIIAVPTVIASIYGMNFVDMPELHWSAGYPGALALMAVSGRGALRDLQEARLALRLRARPRPAAPARRRAAGSRRAAR